MKMPLDQFYTRPDLSRAYVGQILKRWRDPDVLFVEPSAGVGAFVSPLLTAGRKVCAIDIDPKKFDMIQSDFLQFDLAPLKRNHSAIVVVGNPPFGKNASTAVRFFNHAAQHADEIAFIVPRTFRKFSLQKRLHEMFHLSHDEDVVDQAFIRFGNPHNVPCAWQIWTQRKISRPVKIPPPVDHLIIYTTPANACFAMRRVGFHAGRITTEEFVSLSKSTHYFIKEAVDGVVDALRSVDWTALSAQTAGSRSLSKAEIAFKLNEAYYSQSIRHR